MIDVLTIAGIPFDDWSTPTGLPFGGYQEMVVHKLPGGNRCIDTLGPDEADMVWRGKFFSNTAFEDALAIDAIRQAQTASAPSNIIWKLGEMHMTEPVLKPRYVPDVRSPFCSDAAEPKPSQLTPFVAYAAQVNGKIRNQTWSTDRETVLKWVSNYISETLGSPGFETISCGIVSYKVQPVISIR